MYYLCTYRIVIKILMPNVRNPAIFVSTLHRSKFDLGGMKIEAPLAIYNVFVIS